MSVAKAPERVLSTLNEDGSRFRIRPRPAPGRFQTRRAVVGYGLIALFVVLPFIRIGGKPALMIDLVHRELAVLGATFRPSDGAVLMLLGLVVVLAVFLVTALFGRVWCGWGCPQTVYMELVFRPLERLFEGGAAGTRHIDERGGWPPRRIAKNLVFAVLSIGVANVFLAYFVGTDQLAVWMRGSPATHPAGFAIMAGVSVLMFLDFAWFREQVCIVACPYGRLQTVLLDRGSTIVGYDARRGEPRGKARKALPVVRDAPAPAPVGDCVDCNACVATCPTGIDIRRGLQMECIGCAQCIDACDTIMDKLDRPRGLIRYASQDQLAGLPRKRLRARRVIYPALLLLALGLLLSQLSDRPSAEVWALRVEGAPFTVLGDGRVSTQARLRIENRTGATRRYTVQLVGEPTLELMAPRGPVEIAAGATSVVTMIVMAPAARFERGEGVVVIRIHDDAGFVRDLRHTLLGPDAPSGGAP